MTQLQQPLRTTVGRDDDGTMFILRGDGSAASFKDGVWHPGLLWDGKTICEYRAVTDPLEIERCVAEASEALAESLDH
jgi:hypothetical protein